MKTVDELAPVVRFEACDAFKAEPDCPWCSCARCGWPEDAHEAAYLLAS
jgi:hypothetical protein